MERIGKYVVHKSVQTTGYARIVFCHDPDLQIPVALKVFAAKASDSDPLSVPQWLTRFQAEARALATFDHPHIIAVKSMETGTSGRPFFVMPYMAANLRFEIGKDNVTEGEEKSRRLPLARALSLLKQTSSGLMSLHRRGMVHRAVKPGNLLLTARENGQIKLADFSMVKLPERNPPLPDHWMGDTDYCAPEQRESATTVDARADVYSLGVLACRLLTGTLPDLSAGAVELPGKFSELLVKLVRDATDPDPAKRPAHAGAFLQGLGQVPVEAAAKPKVHVVPMRRVPAATKAALPIAGE
ncbi:putative Probable serine/threonine-protein kinase pknL [Magnetospirillum gryphiswaldense MSR-1 v2]|uniref:Probable serine/threonine-protein kinase pknL n=1 Tax=Magnetospirillum gryphiswaldense (strain DSM 6361 / JCM 21280 / NBRC 15271 / MSR-1) TaxID=431944 RepID=V6F6U1_MAGGM|nr:serine/threonine-protein kinase [Magnetospirillum gryphiswaldense]CDL00026.1 putative Probable serine/threonine-protein kinase pknL [Magnetospirillum gryphiswaldense MSR-1 v2]